jgi:GH24 family phage-related lysozyme (muramidase)
MDLRTTAVSRTKGFEAFCEHFYLDTTSNVTVGYGRMLPNTAATAGLSLSKADGTAASAKEKSAEWTAIKAQPAGKPASWYKKHCTLTIGEPDAATLIEADLKTAIGYLAGKFADLDSYPEDAQDALLDMIFNIGTGNFTAAKWPGLFAAVNAEDWKKAADQSNRPQVSAARNAAIKQLFLDAAAPALLGAVEVEPGALQRALQDNLAGLLDLLASTKSDARLFPHGITSITLSASGGGVELSLAVRGPDAGQASGAAVLSE